MSIYVEKRKGVATGRLIVEVERDGKRIRKPATTRKEALRIEGEIRAGMHDEYSKSVQTHTGLSLKAFTMEAEKLWDGTKDRKQSVNRLRVFMDKLGEVMRSHKLPETAEAVKTMHITETINRIEKEQQARAKGRPQGIKASTVNRYVSAGSKAFTWLTDQERLPKCPKFDWREAKPGEVFYLSHDQEAKLRDYLKDLGHGDCITIMDVQLATGLRIGEVLKLTADKITKDDDETYVLDLGLTKNGKERIAILSEDVGSRFLDMIECGLPSYTSVRDRIRLGRKKLGMPLTQPTHAHRHTVATRLAADDVNALSIKDFMGHSSLATTDRYTHHNKQSKKALLKRLIAPKEAVA